MRSHRKQIQRLVVASLLSAAALLLLPNLAYAKNQKQTATWRPNLRPASSPILAKAPQRTTVKPSGSAVTSSLAVANDKKTINLRLHPLYLVPMISDRNTTIAGRVDLDFVLGGGVTLGPSLIFHQTSRLDEEAATAGTTQFMDEQVLEVGLLSNIYLKGDSSSGGFLLRPHIYWIDASGERTAANDSVLASSTNTQGLRGGSELVYQIISPSGFNLEIGGGFTYHLLPYQINYPTGGTGRTEPENRLVPSITAGVGWAF